MLRKITAAKTVELVSALMALGQVTTLTGNPRFYIDHPYLSGVDRLVGGTQNLLFSYGLLAFMQLLSLYVTRKDQTDEMSVIGDASPDKRINRPWIYVLRATGFTLSFAIWLWTMIVTNVAMLFSPAHTSSTNIFLHLLIIPFSALYAVNISVNFAASRQIRHTRKQIATKQVQIAIP